MYFVQKSEKTLHDKKSPRFIGVIIVNKEVFIVRLLCAGHPLCLFLPR
jgi:hypothetical protein